MEKRISTMAEIQVLLFSKKTESVRNDFNVLFCEEVECVILA